MIKKALLLLISACVFSNINNSNASSTIRNKTLKHELSKEMEDNSAHNQQYWNEFLPTIKCDAKETVKDRFDYCTDKLLEFLTKDFYKKAVAIDNYKYEVEEIDDIIDIENLKKEIDLRKSLLNCSCRKNELKNNAWSQLPLIVYSYNDDQRNKIGRMLFYNNNLLRNHWDMKFTPGFNNIKLNFYPSYEFQEPQFFKNSVDSEKTLSICLSAIEMDLLTSNNITSNIELFASRLISKKNDCADKAIARYEKYFTKEQNAMLARHIISYYLSSLEKKNNNIAKNLINKYLLPDLFNNMKPNQFLKAINNYRTDDWFDAVIKQYLQDAFGTSYNKDYLKSLQTLILDNLKSIKPLVLPVFKKYTSVIFSKLININRKIIDNDKEYLKTRHDIKKLKYPKNKEEYELGNKILTALYGASAQTGIRSIDNIISYLPLNSDQKSPSKKHKK